jgi:hypothetical protein
LLIAQAFEAASNTSSWIVDPPSATTKRDRHHRHSAWRMSRPQRQFDIICLRADNSVSGGGSSRGGA